MTVYAVEVTMRVKKVYYVDALSVQEAGEYINEVATIEHEEGIPEKYEQDVTHVAVVAEPPDGAPVFWALDNEEEEHA